jgi:hypothetical protein
MAAPVIHSLHGAGEIPPEPFSLAAVVAWHPSRRLVEFRTLLRTNWPKFSRET